MRRRLSFDCRFENLLIDKYLILKYYLSILVLLVSIFLLGCSVESECRQTESVRCVIVFACDSVVVEEDTTYIRTFSAIDSVTVCGVGMDSVLYDNAKGVSKLSLPLRSDTTATCYDLTLNSRHETLVVEHKNNEYFVSLACGCFVFHEVDTAYGANGFIRDSEVLNTAVENIEQNNIRLYISF